MFNVGTETICINIHVYLCHNCSIEFFVIIKQLKYLHVHVVLNVELYNMIVIDGGLWWGI